VKCCVCCVCSARQWLDSRPLTQKQFVDVMVRSMARKATPTECQLCQCIADDAQVGVSECRSCHRRLPFILVTAEILSNSQPLHIATKQLPFAIFNIIEKLMKNMVKN